ncbi:MAG: efflux transporter outer membrane subunit [Alphaproteobacteria bacterium]
MTVRGIKAGVAIFGLGLAACTVGPDYAPPETAVPDAYRTEYAPKPEDSALWWRGFEDETLNGLVEQALEENLEIGIAVARLAEAQALSGAERSDLFPSLDGAVEGSARRDTSGNVDTEGAALGLFSFAPDLFGGQRRRLERARALAKAAGYTLEDVRRLSAAEVAERYVALRRAQARLDLLTTSLDLQRQTLEIVRERYGAGLAADLDVQRAAADLARTQSQRGTLATAKARAENALAVLLGRAPADSIAPPADEESPIPVYAGGPPAGVPADLVRQRPDILAAEAELAAATAEVGVETADLYPSLRLPGQVTASLGGAEAMAGQVTALLGATLDIPLFDAGRRRAEVDAAEHRVQAALLNYRQTLLDGLGEVENALAAIQGFEERRAELQRAVEASEQAFNQLNALYREGLASFIDILDAQRTLIGSREAYVEAQADLASAIIGLYRALGAPTRTDSSS